ncbi:MAG: sulfite reductase subunit beta [Isosphaeraceae bacterium]|nr:MAG: sulfite reductase subunit beta [Isosphaeraceae bacterium]
MAGELGSRGKPSKVELLKEASDYLRGQLPEELAEPGASISEDAASILKFHGSYQQDDRDERLKRKREGLDKAYSFMVRIRIPGGRITAAQYLVCDDLARRFGNGSLRITTRQEFQLHGVLKQDLKPTIRTINEALLSTLAACGDVERNVLACPAPIKDALHDQLQTDAHRFAAHCAPRSSSYWELWLDGERVEIPDLPPPGPSLVPTPGDDPVEPIYGKAYLPRKFKTAFSFPDDNCTDVYANDLGYLAVVEAGRIVGYNVIAGGGLGTTPSAAKTFPALAVPVGYVERDRILHVGEAILKIFRDFGNRSDRKRARLKYVIYDWGADAFRAKVGEYLGAMLEPSRPMPELEVHDHLGWHDQGDGRLWLGLPVDCGRIRDESRLRLLSGLRAFFERYGTPARLTCQQSILLIDLDPAWRGDIERWLEEYGIATVEQISTVRRWSMACPALPTCGLAVTEAERAFPGLMAQLEAELSALGLADERLTVRMTGCPNGCARPYNCDIGLVGRSAAKTEDGGNQPGTYTIYLGGRAHGDRLTRLYQDYVPFDQIGETLRPLLARFRDERLDRESFGDFCDRLGLGSERGVTAEAASQTLPPNS